MDGFADGVAHYNKTKGKNVQVLGWDKAKQNGTFADDFADQAKGKAITNTLVAQGADVIMPVAGGTGLGAADVAKASGGKVSVIWVDQDGCKSAAQYCDVFLTTVVKNITDAVEKAVVDGATGKPLAADPGLPGHAGEQRCLAGAVQPVRQQGRRRPQGRGRQAEGGHHRRHGEGRVGQRAEVTLR